MRNVLKRTASLLLCISLLLGLGTVAFADETNAATAAARLYDLSIAGGYTLVPKDINGNTVAAGTADVDEDSVEETVYEDVEKLQLGFTGVADKQYAVFLLYNTQVPTDGNIRYIDQHTGKDGAMTATIFPDQMAAEGTYYVYISTADAYTQIGSFKVLGPEYVLGDVNADGYITAYDASLVLQRAAGLINFDAKQTKAADTSKDGYITAYDASLILQRAAGLITEF